MIRSINYRVDEKSIDPSNKQRLGVQRENNATEIGFDVSNMPSYGDFLWRIDFDHVTAGHSAGIPEEAAEGKISRLLPYDMTRFGGDVQITLVGTRDGEIVCSIPVFGYLEASQKSEPSEDKQAIDVSSAEYSARKSAANAIDAAERAETSAEEAKRSEELTEDARRILEEGTKFVFMGGNAKSKHRVDIVVEDTLTEYGTNPVESQAIFKEFLNVKDDFRDYVQGRLSDLSRSLYDTIMNNVHPVGSIYISESATNPANLFGGSWKRITDTFILAAGDKFPIGDGGGQSEITLTEAQMPAHTHKATDKTGVTPDGKPIQYYQFSLNKFLASDETGRNGVAKGSDFTAITADRSKDGYDTEDLTGGLQTAATGKGEPINIMPPYVTRYVWQRIA